MGPVGQWVWTADVSRCGLGGKLMAAKGAPEVLGRESLGRSRVGRHIAAMLA
jgi:hypothetical protein